MRTVDASSAPLSLAGQRALVSGGSGGIGAAVVAQLLKAGAEVSSLDRPDCPVPDGARGIGCDLADPHQLEQALAVLVDKGLAPDLLIHCAGITRDRVVWKLSDQAWSEVLRVNLDSAFQLIRALVPAMREKGSGRIVLVSSINGERGKIGQANYTASKAGLIALARTTAKETGRFGIRVNVVAPGLIRTAMTRELPAEILERAVEETALGQLGEPEDVAAAVLFLCAPMSRHITGQVLRVDGGQLMA